MSRTGLVSLRLFYCPQVDVLRRRRDTAGAGGATGLAGVRRYSYGDEWTFVREGVMVSYLHYEHHGGLTWVRSDLIGKHKEYCLCYKCADFKPDHREGNCPRANLLYAIDVILDMVTPVWECPDFEIADTEA